MFKKAITILILTLLVLNCIAQNRRLAPVKHRDIRLQNSYYNKKYPDLINHINNLKYDSIKVFSFNCTRIDWIYDVGFKLDSSKLYFNLNPNNPCYAFGKALTKKDMLDLVSIFKYSYNDVYKSDPIGPYIPTMGFAFFNKGLVCAHIEVGVETDKANIEIFNKNGIPFKYKYIILGDNMHQFFLQRFEKYNLHCCD